MSDKKTLDEEEERMLEEETEDVARLLDELEEKMTLAGIKLSDGELKTLSAVKVKLDEHRKAEKAYLKRIVDDGVEAGEFERVAGGVTEKKE
jgi:hypothetical protein